MSYGYFRQYPQLPRALIRNHNASPRVVPPGLWVTGTVYSTVGATTATVLAMAEDHYGVGTLDALAAKLDPDGEVNGTPRSMEDFCQAWWGRPFADCIHEILLWERWFNLERQSSLLQTPGVPSLPLRYYGGDMLDSTTVGTGADTGRRVWVGADFPISLPYCINLQRNIALVDSLPFRNHVTSEFLDGEVDTYGRTHTADAIGGGWRAGASDTWVIPDQTAFPGTIYWNLTAMSSGGAAGILFWVFASLVETPTDGQAFFDLEVKDTHCMAVNVFGTANKPTSASDPGVFGIGPAGTFYVYGVLNDTTHNYFYGIEFSPPSGDFTPNHGQNILTTDTEYTRIARLPVATAPTATGHTGTVYTDYEFWTGSGWSSDLANAARLVDTGGTPIKGYFHAAKIASGHYMAVSQGYPETVKHCYYSTTPTGPWWNYKNVPTPPIGPNLPEIGQQRTNGYNKLLTFAPARTNYVMTMGTQLVFNAVTKVGKHIGEMDTPYVISVPTKDAAEVTHSTAPPSAVHRMRPLLVR